MAVLHNKIVCMCVCVCIYIYIYIYIHTIDVNVLVIFVCKIRPRNGRNMLVVMNKKLMRYYD